ncbi:MAG: baseplate J/gp47 family protein, partial [Deltaproteobacteria bacterium]|nr:baseplate J/gp47 family protein [Deltaproteobacteria bacterium]
MGKNTVTVLETPYPPGAAVRNIEPASGGADPETIEEAKLRGPWTLKHRYRAVTLEDFEHLAKEASPEVARTTCYEGEDAIQVIVLPKTGSDKPQPSFRLIQKVTEYLDARRLITTRLRVGCPEYEGIYIEIAVVLTAQEVGRFPQIRINMERALKKVTHPLYGGPDSKGWPMGRIVHISEFYYLLESIRGVDYVDKVRMKKWDSHQWEEKIRI